VGLDKEIARNTSARAKGEWQGTDSDVYLRSLLLNHCVSALKEIHLFIHNSPGSSFPYNSTLLRTTLQKGIEQPLESMPQRRTTKEWSWFYLIDEFEIPRTVMK